MTQDASRTDRPNIHDLAVTEHRRPRLLPERREREGYERALQALGERRYVQERTQEFQLQDIEAANKAIAEASRVYWDRREYDERRRPKELKKKCVDAAKHLLAVRDFLSALDAKERNYLNQVMMHRSERMSGITDRLSSIISNNQHLLDAIEKCSALSTKREAKQAVIVCCRLLWDAREALTKRVFKRRRWEIHAGREKAGIKHGVLSDADAEFVQVTLQAFDPKVTVEAVRSALLEIVKEKTVGSLGEN